MGAGANNATVVANGGDGLLVSGSSSEYAGRRRDPAGQRDLRQQPQRHRGDATRPADSPRSTPSPGSSPSRARPRTRRDGILITSSGGNNLIRTCIVSGNLGNGIELGGQRDRRAGDRHRGRDEHRRSRRPSRMAAMASRSDGHAHGNAIGGFQPSIEPQVTVSANRGYGIEIAGSAHNNAVFHTYIGTNAEGTADLGNKLGRDRSRPRHVVQHDRRRRSPPCRTRSSTAAALG